MAALVDLSWRLYPCLVLMAAGLAVLFVGVRKGFHGLFRLTSTAQIVALMGAFRTSVVGLTLAAVGAAWLWHIEWLFVLALVFGGEEFYESSAYLAILRRPRPVG